MVNSKNISPGVVSFRQSNARNLSNKLYASKLRIKSHLIVQHEAELNNNQAVQKDTSNYKEFKMKLKASNAAKIKGEK